MASIADLFAKLLLDDSGFEASVVKSATKAGDAAGQTMGQRMSATLKTTLGVGAKVAATALAGGLAIAARGAAELENITADFQAATGASADEAEHASKVINRVAGSERQSLQAVSAAAIAVKRDLGASGPEADKLTEQIVRFARVTKQDAAGAVKALDDIVDGYGLTLSDVSLVQDTLIAGVQKFGGSITENQAALAKMAPQLKALNLGWKDGAELLNLFAASGLDASAGQKALNTAIQKLNGESFPAFAKRLSGITDDGERARVAMEILGTKGGASLANALKPGMKGLSEFGFTEEEVTGKSDDMAEALDNTFTGRVQKAISQATAGLREFGQGFGPALTGLASLSTLAGALGGGKLVSGILGPIGGLGKKLALRLAAAIGIGFASSAVSGAAEAGGEAVANMSTKAIQRRLAGKAVSDTLAKGLSDGLIGVESSSLVKSSTDRLGKFMGSTLGKALSVAFAAVAVVELAKTYSDVADAIKQQTVDLAKQTGEFTETATLAALVNARKGVAEQLDAMGHDPIAEALGLSAHKGVEETLAQLDAAIERHGPQTGKLLDDVLEPIKAIPGELAKVNAGPATNQIVGAIERSLGLGSTQIAEAAKILLASVPDAVRQASYAAALAAAKTPGEIAAAISSRRAEVDTAMDNLTSVIKNNKGTERAKVLGYLIGSELAKALKSKDPLIRATAEDTQKLLLGRLEEVIPANGQIGKKAMDQLNEGIKSKNPAVAAQARKIKEIVEEKIKANTPPIGRSMGQGVADGIKAKQAAAVKAARALAVAAAKALESGWGNPVLEANLKVVGKTAHELGLNAKGGPVKKGEISWVGEEGPELMEFGGDAFITPADVSKRAIETAPDRGGRPESPSAGAAVANGVKAAAVAFVGAVVPPLRDVIVHLGKAAPIKAPPAPPVTVNVIVKSSTPAGGRSLAPSVDTPRLVASAVAQRVKRVPGPGMPQSFARGGVVKGPPGQPVGIIAHGGEEVVPAKSRREPETVSTAIVHAITRTLSDIAHRVSDTTIVMRRIVEGVERASVTPAAKAQGASAPRVDAAPVSPAVVASVAAMLHKVERVASPAEAQGRSAHPPTPSVSTTIVNVLTRSLTEVVRRVSDTSDVLRRITEKVERPERPERPIVPAAVRPAQAGPTITVRKPGMPMPIATPPPEPGYPASLTPAVQPVAPRAVAQAVQTRVKQMREAMLPGPWMPAAAIADVGGSLRPPAPHVPSFRAPSIAPARVPSGLAAVPAAGGGSVREGDIHVNLLDKLEVRSVRDIGGGLRMLGEQGYLGPKGPGRRKS